MNYFFLLLCLAPFSLFSQSSSWFEPGSSWTYNYELAFSSDHYQSTFGISETVFAGKACTKMEPEGNNPFLCSPVQPPYYFYELNDSVFYASETDSIFRLAYNFNAQVNESWTYVVPFEFNNSADTFNVVVQNVSQTEINGNTIKEIQLEYANISQNPNIYIYPQEISVMEYLGAIGNFFIPFGQWGPCDGENNVKLQCFTSPTFEYVNPEFGSCTVSVPTISRQSLFQIYPNPTSKTFTVELPENESGKLRIMQLDGKMVFSQILTSASDQIELPSLSPGMYIVEVSNAESRYFGKLQIL